jgi:hypothetical protein
MRNFIRRKAVDFIAKHLFVTIVEEDLLRKKGGTYCVRGIQLTKEQHDLLVEQAGALKESALWSYLKKDLKHHAIQKALNDSQTMNDVVSAKLLLYLIDVVEERLYNLSRGK